MAKVLFLSREGSGYPLATRIADQGDEVDFYIQEAKGWKVLEGGNPKVLLKFPPFSSDYDLIIPDVVGMGRLADRYRKAGKTVFSGGALGDLISTKVYGEKVANLIGLPYSYQIPKGVQVIIGGFFDSREWVTPFYYSFKQTRFMEGDRGLNTECMGTTIFLSERDKLIETSLLPLQTFLKKARYIGPFNIHLSVDQEGVTFLKFDTSFDYDSIFSFGEVLQEEWYNIFKGISIHTLPRIPTWKRRYAISVRLSLPPYPQKGFVDIPPGVQIVKLLEPAKSHLWLQGVFSSRDGQHVMTSGNGVVGCITAWGETVREAQRRVYRTIGNMINSQEVQFRKDIGEGVEEKVNTLKLWGWLNEHF